MTKRNLADQNSYIMVRRDQTDRVQFSTAVLFCFDIGTMFSYIYLSF